MVLDLHFRFDWGRPRMSERSQKLAGYANHFLKNQPLANEANANRNRILNEGFSRLRSDLRGEFAAQVDELNHEPACGNVLICRFSGEKQGVYRIDDEESILSIEFDPHLRIVKITCDKPVKFDYFIEVGLTNDETRWYYKGGEKKKELAPCGEKVDWIVDRSLYALFGVRAS